MRNGKNPILRWMASIYVSSFRNVPNLLLIFIIFSIFQLKSGSKELPLSRSSAGGLGGIRGGSIDHGQTEAGLSQGFNNRQIFIYIIFPQAIRKMLPSIISQFITVIRDTSFLLLCYLTYRIIW